MARKPRDGYIKEHKRKPKGLAFSRLNKYEIIDDPSKTFPIGGFFGRFDFLMSLSGEVWPEGLVVHDHRRGKACDELVVRYKYADREGVVDKFMVSTETGLVWQLNPNGGFRLVRAK